MNFRWAGLILCELTASCCIAQGWTESSSDQVLAAIENNGRKYEALGTYELVTDMASYRSFEDISPFDEGRSVMMRQGDQLRIDALGVIVIQNDLASVTIDTTESIILITDPNPLINTTGAENMRKVVESAAKVWVKQVGRSVRYGMDMQPGAYYKRVEILFDEQGWLSEMVSIWNFYVEEDPSDPATPKYKPKLVFRFSKPRAITAAFVRDRLDMSRYIEFKTSQPAAVGKYGRYEVRDNRISQFHRK